MNLFRIKDGNWGLKLLALVLAVVIYYTIHYTIKYESARNGRTHDRRLFQQPL